MSVNPRAVCALHAGRGSGELARAASGRVDKGLFSRQGRGGPGDPGVGLGLGGAVGLGYASADASGATAARYATVANGGGFGLGAPTGAPGRGASLPPFACTHAHVVG